MTFIDTAKTRIVQFDILISELIKSAYSRECNVVIVSPWVQDFSMPATWPSFTSNFIDIQDMQRISDILKRLRQNDVKITLVTRSDSMLKKDGWSNPQRKDALDFHERLKKVGVKICYNEKVHDKVTLTSEQVLVSSANLTNKGTDKERQDNSGILSSRLDEDKNYNGALEEVQKVIKESIVV